MEGTKFPGSYLCSTTVSMHSTVTIISNANVEGLLLAKLPNVVPPRDTQRAKQQHSKYHRNEDGHTGSTEVPST